MLAWRYTQSHVVQIICCCLAAFLPATLIYLSGFSVDFAILCALLSLGCLLLAGLWGYAQRRSYLRSLMELQHAIEKTNETSTIAGESLHKTTSLYGISTWMHQLEKPVYWEGKLAYDFCEKIAGTAQRYAADSHRDMQQYREYIELWVHEIKTPLAAAHLLVQNNPSAASLQLRAELAKTEKFVEHALFLARSTSLEKDYVIRKVSLSTLVVDAVKSRAQALIGAGFRVELLSDEQRDVVVYTDTKWMIFVLGQLIDNAVRYRSSDPVLCFSAELIEKGSAHERIALSIWDNGCGISQADMGRVFEWGFTGDNGRMQQKSTGIGLYLVQELCHKMGLSVAIDSQKGAWTQLTITFPFMQKWG